jgi:integrase
VQFTLNGITFDIVQRGRGYSLRFWSRRLGKTTWRGLGTRDLWAAEIRAHEIAIAETRPPERPGHLVMVGDVLSRDWQLHARHQRSAETHRYLRRDYLAPAFAHHTVSELTLDRQEQLRDQMLEAGLSPSYISLAFSSLSGALRRAKKRHELTDYPEIIDIKRPEPKEQRILSVDEIAALLQHAPPHLARYIWIAIGTAGRPWAILELTWPQIDVARRLIHFNAPGRVQTRKRRATVPLIDALVPILTKPTGFYVIEYRGRPIRAIDHALRLTAVRTGLDPRGLSPKTFRHTIGVELRLRDVPEWECMGLLGHRGTSRVTEVYARFRPSRLSAAARAISAFVEAVRQGATNTPPDLVETLRTVSGPCQFRPRTSASA